MNPERNRRRQILLDRYVESRSLADRNALVESYGALAEYFAARYRDRGVASEDLSQVAQLALIKAADRFDPDVGVRFSTFAGRTIDGELKRYFRDRTWTLRVPRRLKELTVEVRRAVEELTSANGRSPSVAELADHIGIDPELVVEALDAQDSYRPASLDRPVVEDGSMTLADLVGGLDREFGSALDALTVSDLLDTLGPREQRILRLRFYENLSQAEIADRVGLSQMHISRLLRSSFKRLRDRLDEI